MLYKAAIVEDESDAAELLERHLNRYGEKHGIEFTTVRYENPIILLTNYRSDFDVIFMDIDMPQMNGLEASRQLRSVDGHVPLVFVTNLSQFAVKGYEVQAFDFVVKPVSYYEFALKMDRICKYIENRSGEELLLTQGKGYIRLRTTEITYIETSGHQLLYHTADNVYSAYGSLKTLEANPKLKNFARCNACFLINLRFVRRVDGYTVMVGEDTLEISRPKRKEFINRLNEYWGGMN